MARHLDFSWGCRGSRVGCNRFLAGDTPTYFAASRKTTTARTKSRLVFTALYGFDSESVRELIHSRG